MDASSSHTADYDLPALSAYSASSDPTPEQTLQRTLQLALPHAHAHALGSPSVDLDLDMTGEAPPLLEGTIKKKAKAAPRTSRACLHCRKQKMRCEGSMDPPCKRCKQGGLECTFERRSEFTLNATDSTWQTSIQRSLSELQSTVSQILSTLEARGQGISIDPNLFTIPTTSAGVGGGDFGDQLGAINGGLGGISRFMQQASSSSSHNGLHDSIGGEGVGIEVGIGAGYKDEGKGGIQVGNYEDKEGSGMEDGGH